MITIEEAMLWSGASALISATLGVFLGAFVATAGRWSRESMRSARNARALEQYGATHGEVTRRTDMSSMKTTKRPRP